MAKNGATPTFGTRTHLQIYLINGKKCSNKMGQRRMMNGPVREMMEAISEPEIGKTLSLGTGLCTDRSIYSV